MRLLIEGAQNKDWDWHLAAPPGSQAAKRLKPFAKVLETPMRGLRQIRASKLIADYVRRNKIQLIDCQSSQAHQLGLMVKMRVPSLKLVVHRRVDYAPGASWFNRKKYLSPRIDRYVAISGAIGKILQDYGVPQSQLNVVRSAVDDAPFRHLDRAACRAELLKELGLPDDRIVIGNVAYITEQKGHATLVKALGRLKAAGEKFFCFIAGDGALRADCEALAASLHLGPNDLRFLGVRNDVPKLLGASDIFALSSNDEGLGTSLLDAVHAGAVLVASDVGGIPEIVIEGRTGLLAPARDDAEFARQLTRVLKDAALRADLAKNAKAHAAAEFSLMSMVTGNLLIYKELIQGRS